MTNKQQQIYLKAALPDDKPKHAFGIKHSPYVGKLKDQSVTSYINGTSKVIIFTIASRINNLRSEVTNI